MDIPETIEAQRSFFLSGATLRRNFRETMLRKLLDALDRYEDELYAALWKDLHKSRQEAYLTETGIVRSEIRTHLRQLRSWMKPERHLPSAAVAPSGAKVMSEPLGCALIIAPWNYPVQLLLNPLVGAISAGCTAVLKTSPAVPTVAAVLEKLVSDTFPPEYVAAFGGHRDVNTELLSQKFDIIFFTGSPSTGKVVMEAAARKLTPVVLELGGKSPCIVDAGADIRTAARKIAWGKSLNAGQTCIAPDYLMIHSSRREEFVAEFGRALGRLYGPDLQACGHYSRMVSTGAFDRVKSYIDSSEVLYGGRCCRESLFIEPALVVPSGPDAPVMQEEIFGPVLPLLEFSSLGDAREFIVSRPSPLALYYFGPSEQGRRLAQTIRCGGMCINDTIMHIAAGSVPFGGTGESGMGCYHGRDSFLAFSHRKTVLESPKRLDLPFRYPPYRFFALIRKILG